jgi:hypothetical protein
MLKAEDVERARRVADRIERWAKTCVVFMTDAAAVEGETEAERVERDHGLTTTILLGLAVLPPMLTIMADEHKYDRDAVMDGILEAAVKDYRTIDQGLLLMKVKAATERVGKWIASRAGKEVEP